MAQTDLPLAGRTALVTGASRGVGKGVAVELGAAGATVYITARTVNTPGVIAGTGQETAEQVSAMGGKGIALRCDHADDEQVEAVVRAIAEEAGGLDVLVNNVYSTPELLSSTGPWMEGGKPFWEVAPDAWNAAFNIGVRAHYVMAQKAMPLLFKRSGLIVDISSCGADRYFHSVLYGAGKAASDRMTRDMAYELRNEPVTILTIWPGIVHTELVDIVAADDDTARFQGVRGCLRLGWAKIPGSESELAQIDDTELSEFVETPRFTGRAVAALAADPNVRSKSGTVFSTVGLADEYGFTDVDGRTPDGFRFRDREAWPTLS